MLLRKKLKNGMSVIMEKRDLPVVALSITNRFGAIFEKSKDKGICHFIEHLVFTGTKTRTHEDISREIEKKGGVLNAFTSHEVTSFWFKLPSEHVFAGLDILSDMLLNPTFKDEKFEKEKKVIIEEIKMYHDAPQRDVYDKIENCLYDKPFGESVIGSEGTIKSMKRDFVYKYFNDNYAPENYVVTVVGNANFDEICNYIEKKFPKKSNKLVSQKIKLKHGKYYEEREGLDQSHFVFAIHAPLWGTKEYYALDVLDAYLANGMSSRLFLKIREEKGLAYAVRSSINAEKSYSYYTIYAGTRKEAIDEITKIILEEFKNIKNMTEKDLKEAKERLIGLRRIAREESSSVMNELMFNELAGKAENYYEYEKNISTVTLEDIKKLAKIDKYSTAAIVPK